MIRGVNIPDFAQRGTKFHKETSVMCISNLFFLFSFFAFLEMEDEDIEFPGWGEIEAL